MLKLKYIILLFIITSFLNAKASLVGSIEGDLNVNMGRLNYSLPLSLPKGKNNIVPSIKIYYSQGAGDGILGLGFNISGLSIISRCGATKKIDGYNGGITYGNNAHYCLDGIRLIKQEDGTFRPANRSDIKVEAVGSATNPTSWLVYSNNGTIKEYGKNNAIIKNGKYIKKWYISSVKDRLKNNINYIYKKINNVLYISKISYKPYNIEFHYEKRTKNDSLITYSDGKKIYLDRRISRINIKLSNKLFSYYKLSYSNKLSQLKSITWCDRKNKCLKPIKFDYKKADNTVAHIEEKNLLEIDNMLNYHEVDINRDGLNDILYFEKGEGLKYSLNDGYGNFDAPTLWTESINNSLKYDTKNRAISQAIVSTLMPVDLDNNGFIDYCIATQKGIFCGLNDGNGGIKEEKYWTTKTSIKEAYRYIDINQDNKIDICKFTKKGFSCAVNNGHKFGKFKVIDKEVGKKLSLYKEIAKANYTDKSLIPQPQLFDINGDGRSDLCGFNVNNSSFYCKLGIGYDKNNKRPKFSNRWVKWGSGFPLNNKKIKWKKIDTRNGKINLGALNYYTKKNYKLFEIDIDFNGKYDLCYYKKNKKELYCALNTTLNKYAKEDKTEVIKRFNRTFRFIDLNNDKLPDICYRKANNYVCRINNGKSFNKEKKWLTLDKKTWPFYVAKYKKEDIDLFFKIIRLSKDDRLALLGKKELRTHIIKIKENNDLRWLVNMQEGSIAMRDIDGDGLADFTAIIAEELYWAKNLGTSFGKLKKLARLEADVDIITSRKTIYANWLKKLFGLSTEIETNFVNTAYGPVKMMSDLDGKNNKELCYRSSYGLSCFIITNKPFSLLSSVTNSLGKKSKIQYGKIITDNLKNNLNSDYPNSYYTNSFVVKSITSDNGIGGTNKMLYKYGKMVYSNDNKPLGFDSTTQINTALKAKSTTYYYRKDNALNGQVKKVESYINNRLLSQQKNTYEEVKQEYPYLNYARLIKKTELGYDIDGDELFEKTTEYEDFNEYNTPRTVIESITDSTGLDYEIVTNTEYYNDPVNWIINKPTNVSVIHDNGKTRFTKHTKSSYYDNGRLKSMIIEPGTNNYLKTEYKYNKNVIITTVTSKDGTRVSKKFIDSLDRVVKTVNALNQVTSQISYDSYCIHQPKSVTDINKITTTYKYDTQCRLVEKKDNVTGIVQTTKYQFSDKKADRGVDFNEVGFKDDDVSVYMTTTYDNIGSWSRTYYDALERPIRVVKRGYKNKKIIVDTVYDNAGRVIGETIPYYEGHGKGYNAHWIKKHYDKYGRLIKEERPLHKNKTQTIRYSYDGFKTTIISPKKHKKVIYKNALDQTIKIVQNDGTAIKYKYDALGNLIQTKIGNRVTTIKYDKLGRKIALKTPESGKTVYRYNSFGELIYQKDAKGIVSKFTYDKLGRLKTKKTGHKTVIYSYTKEGKVSKIVSKNKNDSWSKIYKYNKFAKLKQKTLNIDDQRLIESYYYDSIGRLREKVYPSGMSLKYYYTSNNYLDRITIPKSDLWDYKFISLERKLEEVVKYIAQLEVKANKLEKRLIYYSKKSEQYRRYARNLINRIKKEDANVRKYYRLSKRMDSYIRTYSVKLQNFRRKINYIKQRVGNVTFKYVKRVGKYYQYRYTKCVKKNWKGHCKKYKSVTFNIPNWLITGKSRYCSGGWKHRKCKWGPQRYIKLSSIYSKMSSYYKGKINSKKREKKNYENKKNKAKRAKAYYKRKYKQYIKTAKYFAKAARREANMLLKVQRELENQKKVQAELEKAIDKHSRDDSEQLIWSATSYNAKGQVEGELTGNGYLTTRYYDADGTISQIKVGVGRKLIANYTYGYDDRNNLIQRKDNISHITERFSYDKLDRLSSWRLSSKKLNILRRYRYDIYGNIIYKSNVGSFSYNSKNQIIAAPSKLGYFSYDKNGNMLNGDNKTYLYNSENQVIRIEYNKHRAYEEYLYDESENIIRTNNSKGELSYKLGDYEITYKRENNKDNIYMYHRIYANGNQVALHIKHLINGRKEADRTLYFHRDNLGTTVLTTDNMARVVNKDLYTPFGEKISLKKAKNIYKGILDNRLPGFTGHSTIEGANVILMKSRVYDPVIARFTSPDTIVPDVNSALGFNRYAYVYNNPLKYVDPDGHFPLLFFAGAALFTVGATSDNAIVKTIGMTVGGLMMGQGLSGAFGENQAFLEGATRGFAQSVLSGGDISQIFTNTITGGLNAQITGQLPDILNNGDHGFSFGLMLGHGVVQGVFSAIRGGKFKTGFISGAASKISSATINETPLSQADPFVKMSITAILSGMASKASGGDFVQGAMSAMVVWLYNEMGYFSGSFGGFFDPLFGVPSEEMQPIYQATEDTVELTKEKIKDLQEALTLSPEAKKALLDGTDKVSMLLGVAGGIMTSTGVGSEIGIPLMATSMLLKGVVYKFNDRNDILDTAELLRDTAVDEMFAPLGPYGIFGAEALKLYINTNAPIK